MTKSTPWYIKQLQEICENTIGHPKKAIRVVGGSVTCEDEETYCLTCKKVLKEETNC